jgi:hypothetical protein
MAAGTHQIRQPAVIGAIIDLGNCLNLVDSRFLALVKEACETYHETMAKAGRKMPGNAGVGNKARALDCAVIESLHNSRIGTPFQTVRSFFLEGQELYPGAGFFTSLSVKSGGRRTGSASGRSVERLHR